MSLSCPKCHESSLHRSRRKAMDFLPRAFGLIAFRCNYCEHRFFLSRKIAEAEAAGEAVRTRSRHVPTVL